MDPRKAKLKVRIPKKLNIFRKDSPTGQTGEPNTRRVGMSPKIWGRSASGGPLGRLKMKRYIFRFILYKEGWDGA